ncbi:MAG TPA: flavodoxin family protein, partial [Clostridia bacterium]|nr:flavodoxin family protein [Clostridia bacterium]
MRKGNVYIMINILAIYGSHRRGYNSDMLLDKLLEGIGSDGAEVEKVYASSGGIKSCTACEGCYKLGYCVIKDEMQQVYKSIDKADIIIAASPVYFYTVTSHMKKLIDRCQAVWAGKYKTGNPMISKKPRIGYIVCTAGEPEDRSCFDCTVKVFELFYKCINTELVGSLLVSDVDTLQVKDRAYVQQKAVAAGHRLRELIKA